MTGTRTTQTAVLCMALTLLIIPFIVQAETYVTGSVEGTWTIDGSPYICNQDSIIVTMMDTLTIEAGVWVKFHHGTFLRINGVLYVNGEEGDSVRFSDVTISGVPGAWRGLHFDVGLSSSSVIRNAIIAYGEDNLTLEASPRFEGVHIHAPSNFGVNILSGSPDFIDVEISNIPINTQASTTVYCEGGYPEFRNCTIYHPHSDGSAMGFREGCIPTIDNVTITGNARYGIRCEDLFRGSIENCFIAYVDGGIYLDGCQSMEVNHNQVFRTTSSAIWLDGCTGADLHYNTAVMAGNGEVSNKSGFLLTNGTSGTMRNNIAYGSTGYGINTTGGSHIIHDYNLLYSNTEGDYGPTTVAGDHEITGQNPQFISTAYSNPNLSLTWGSPCIDAGYPQWYDPDETRSDIGAIYYNQNVAPEIDSYDPPHLVLSGYSWGDYVDFSVTATDPEGYDLSYRWYYEDNLVSEESTVSIRVFGNHHMRVEVDDNHPEGVTIVEWVFDGLPVDGSEETAVPLEFGIDAFYPNPFNPTGTVRIAVDQPGMIALSVYDLLGRQVADFSRNASMGYTTFQVGEPHWSSGSYFLVARNSAGSQATMRILLVK